MCWTYCNRKVCWVKKEDRRGEKHEDSYRQCGGSEEGAERSRGLGKGKRRVGSKDAPNEIGFELDLPEGAKLAPQAEGSILISAPFESVVSLPGEDERIEAATLAILGTSAALDDGLDELTDEQIEQLAAIPDAKTKTIIETLPVAEIQTPWAVDANGNPVETRFELDVHTLTQIIETNNNTAFPVVADPVWALNRPGFCGGSVSWNVSRSGQVFHGNART